MQFRILHVIESLDRGGAELLFVNYINSLPTSFINIIVYLRPPHSLRSEIVNSDFIYCLDYNSKTDIISAVFKLTKIVNLHHINLVHAHLYWPTILARLAIKKELPLIYSVHTTITDDAYNPNVLSKYLERITYSKNQFAVFVSKAALEDYNKHLEIGRRQQVIYNFIRDDFFSEQAEKVRFSNGKLKLVSVANLRVQKNFFFLITCVGKLQYLPISLDIYGDGPLRKQLQSYIREKKILNVRLLVSHPLPELVLKDYDAFVLPSYYEGFCLAMVEAMAIGLPCIVSALETLKEISENGQLYINPMSEEDLVEKITLLYNEPDLLKEYSEIAKKVALRYNKESHISQLTDLYYNLLEEE